MQYDLIIVGAGFSGMFAGCLAARRNLRTLVMAQGLGGMHLGAGTVDIFDGNKQALQAACRSRTHPYGKAGMAALTAGIEELKAICADGGYPLLGEVGSPVELPTPVGSTRTAGLVPRTMIAGDTGRRDAIAIADLQPFRDFSASVAAANLHAVPIRLPLPVPQAARDWYATDLATMFDAAEFRNEVVALWKPLLSAATKRLGMPAVLGLHQPIAALEHLQSALAIEIFEIATLPPSVPGMRLFNLLRTDFLRHSGELMIGAAVTGVVNNGLASLQTNLHGRSRRYAPNHILLATGGFLHGGLIGGFDRAVQDSVFGIGVGAPARRTDWTDEMFLGAHPFLKLGISVNKDLQPLDPSGQPVATNVRAIGSIMGGADRLSEFSREGIAVASAYRAIEIISGRSGKDGSPS